LIKEVLELVRDGGLLSKSDIADKMGIQEATLENVFSLLSSKGYLKKIDGTTELPRACMSCSVSRECARKASAGNVYIITDKGKLYLKKA
jgi:DeoR/GlpR family transcriptional regulator of sugar metabolism